MSDKPSAQEQSMSTEVHIEPPAIQPAPPTAFVEIAISWPNCWIRFKATQARVSRVMAFMLREASEANAEYEQSLKPQMSPNAVAEDR